jgi:hypothetical protein
MQLITYYYRLVISCFALSIWILPVYAQAPAPSASPAWIDTAPTEPPEQYGRFAQRIGNSGTTAILKVERVSSHDTKNYPVIIQSLVGASPSGHRFQTKSLDGFDTTTNLLGTDSYRSNMTFAQDLAIYVQGELKLTKRTLFSPQFNGAAWKKVQGGTLKATPDFFTVTSSLVRTVGIRKTTYPHPVNSFGQVSVNDLNILTGRVHFGGPKGAQIKSVPVTVTFDYAVRSGGAISKESTVVQGCTSRSLPLKLPVIPFGGEAELLSYSVLEDKTTPSAAGCN